MLFPPMFSTALLKSDPTTKPPKHVQSIDAPKLFQRAAAINNMRQIVPRVTLISQSEMRHLAIQLELVNSWRTDRTVKPARINKLLFGQAKARAPSKENIHFEFNCYIKI